MVILAAGLFALVMLPASLRFESGYLADDPCAQVGLVPVAE